MSGASRGLDEFGEIARLFRPLTRGAPQALELLDDAAVIAARPGYDLVVTKDALVEGVHVPLGEDPALIARKLLRVNLSDLAAKAAEPFGYFLAVAWPKSWSLAARERFAEGLAHDGAGFQLNLLGGDTVSGEGPLTASATMLGYVATGRMVRRAGARAGDVLMVSGPIGDGRLGLLAATEGLADPDGYLAKRYRMPTPRLDLRGELLARAHACADVSDGLVADAGHVARASGLGVALDLDRMPLSPAAHAWLEVQPDRAAALIELATGGDDYELVCAASPQAPPEGFTAVGRFAEGEGVETKLDGVAVDAGPGGWRHS